MRELTVRPYHRTDRQAVLDIAANTAFFGEPVEAFLDDRRLFWDAFYRYYTDFESEHAWVACSNDQVVGFLMGCLDTKQQRIRLLREIWPQTIGNLLRGAYRLSTRTWRYVIRAALVALRGEYPRVDLDVYPAHLHLNLEAAWRGLGLGRRLLETYLSYLRRLGIPGVHLETTNLNQVACQLYQSVGFRLIEAKPTRLWAGLVLQPVENRCFGLKLG